jgi:membrane fusion protein (multidrug efflux system)
MSERSAEASLRPVASPPPEAQEQPRPPPKRAKQVLFVLLVVAGVAGGTGWVLTRNRESTDDAVVEAHVLSVSARTSGQVERVLVKDNEMVEAGQVLVELDARELQARLDLALADEQSAQAQLDLAKAQLEVTERNTSAGLMQARGGVTQAASSVDSSKAQLEQAKADLAAAGVRLKLSSLELERARSLFDSKAIPQAELDLRQATYDQAKAAREQAEARLESTRAAISGGFAGVEQARGRLAAAASAPQQVKAARAQVELAAARYSQAQAALRLAELNLSYATIRAPRRGAVARRSVEVGNLVAPDRPLLALVPLDDVWLVANFKETQIGNMRPGQRAVVKVDTYGGRTIGAHVESLAAGTGSRFALLPPDNASGNFIKVVQRVPVLLRIDERRGLELRPGMSAEVTVLLK